MHNAIVFEPKVVLLKNIKHQSFNKIRKYTTLRTVINFSGAVELFVQPENYIQVPNWVTVFLRMIITSHNSPV